MNKYIAGTILLVIISLTPMMAGPGKAKKQCPTQVTYLCPGSEIEENGLCTAGGYGFYTKGESNTEGWTEASAGNGRSPCGTYKQLACAGTPTRVCVNSYTYPETKVPE